MRLRNHRHLAQTALTAAILLAMGACVPICGIGAKFSLANAHVDPQFNCPYPSESLPYDVHATIDADNSTTGKVTIKSITEEDVLVNTAGSWTGPKDAKGGGPITNYEPKSIASGATATIHLSDPFNCSNSGPTVTTYGEFTIKFAVVTSAGTYKITAANRHRLNIATA